MSRSLDSFERWMVKRNLEYVDGEGADVVVARLRANGYSDVAAAVEAIAAAIGEGA